MKKSMKSKKDTQIGAIAKVNEDGSIVIPEDIRREFKINIGDEVLLMGELGKGIAIVKNDLLLKMFKMKKS